MRSPRVGSGHGDVPCPLRAMIAITLNPMNNEGVYEAGGPEVSRWSQADSSVLKAKSLLIL